MKKLINRFRYTWHHFQSLHIEMIIKDCIDPELRSRLQRKLQNHKDKAVLYKVVSKSPAQR
ncbi:hypothetical protein JOC77_000191 [Peribacillus deserti]|uniref:Uncharacterized protein n=1 Tax=Peribacillus deserti TaxID=673318 RepID=A0ABS2QE56_9BACI|nr:hypothetical protein [Peribacillus deserti]MBM7690788.1 hypothetical protein [Peribacillus deserti]